MAARPTRGCADSADRGETAAAEFEAHARVATDGVLLSVPEDVTQSRHETSQLVFRCDQRWKCLDHVHVVTRDLGEDAVLAKQRDGQHLCEEAWLAALHRLPHMAGGATGRRSQLYRPHQSQAT